MLQKPGNNYDALSLGGTDASLDGTEAPLGVTKAPLGGTKQHQNYFHGEILDHFYERFGHFYERLKINEMYR